MRADGQGGGRTHGLEIGETYVGRAGSKKVIKENSVVQVRRNTVHFTVQKSAGKVGRITVLCLLGWVNFSEF